MEMIFGWRNLTRSHDINISSAHVKLFENESAAIESAGRREEFWKYKFINQTEFWTIKLKNFQPIGEHITPSSRYSCLGEYSKMLRQLAF